MRTAQESEREREREKRGEREGERENREREREQRAVIFHWLGSSIVISVRSTEAVDHLERVRQLHNAAVTFA